jgi:hypothetical protein
MSTLNGHPTVGGSQRSGINYMFVYHEKTSTEQKSTTAGVWNEQACMKSRQKVCYFAMDSVANGSIAHLQVV